MATISEALAFAIQHHRAGRLDQAEQIYRQILAAEPNQPEAWRLLGVLALQTGRHEAAVECLERAIRLKADVAVFHSNLGDARAERGQLGAAAAAYRTAIGLEPDNAQTHNSLGVVLYQQGNLEGASSAFRRAIEIQPDYAGASNNLGAALTSQGRLGEAIAAYRRALELEPELPSAHNNLGIALKNQGEPDEALACFGRAMQLRPDYAEAQSNLLYSELFRPGVAPRELREQHRQWQQRHAAPLAATIRPHLNDRSPERRLRVGYVSPDFRSHPVGRFILPLLEAHDHRRFQIFCYSCVASPDAMTDRCRTQADLWREVANLTDQQLAETVRRDEIDILVDLTMHMAGNRLLAFARKPAPVQVTYLAYCGTTGLSAMDYRLTDPYLDPPGHEEPFYSEESICLPETYWCYRPAIETPAVNPLPALAAAHVTFGCLNNFCKVTAPTLAAWGRLLQTVPHATLVLHAQSGSHRDRVRTVLAQYDVAPERVTLMGLLPTAEYFAVYHQLDVALDPFPYGGGTTTCDSLWMGVPVVSLRGETAVGRGGLSILSNLGMAELAARDVDDYVRIAAELAGDLPRLAVWRSSLRERMGGSPLMDAPRFARNIEAAYRQMWRRWCAGNAGEC